MDNLLKSTRSRITPLHRKRYHGWLLVFIALLMLFGCGGGGGGGGNDDGDGSSSFEILVQLVNQHVYHDQSSEIVLDRFVYGNRTIDLGDQRLDYGASSGRFDINDGASSTTSATAFLAYRFRPANSSNMWSNTESETAQALAGQTLHAGERYTITITGAGLTLMSGAVMDYANLFFRDVDTDPGQIQGTAVITHADDESDIAAYTLHWGADEYTPITSGSEIASLTPDGSDLSHTFNADTPVPEGATHLLLYTTSSGAQDETRCGSVFLDISGTVSRPLPQGNHLYDITYGNGRYIAVGERGTVLTSANGVDWEPRLSGTDRTLSGVTFQDDTFLTVGNGLFLTSSGDAAAWFPAVANNGSPYVQPPPEIELTGIDYGKARFIALGNGKSVLTSQDAGFWLVRENGISNAWHAAACSDALCVVVGHGILSSADTITWEEQLAADEIFSAGYTELQDVIYRENTFLAVGDEGKVMTSSDGSQWDVQTIPNFQATAVAFGAGRYVIVGGEDSDGDDIFDAGIMTSADGSVWSEEAVDILPPLNKVIYADGRFVAVGDNGLILTSSDGSLWTEQSTGPYDDINDLAMGDSQTLFAVGDRGFIASWNGNGWDRIQSQITADLYDMVFDDDQSLYVIVGDDSTVLTSANGTDWTAQTLVPDGIDLRAVACGNGVYVAVGYESLFGKTIRSTDAVVWSAVSMGTTQTFGDIMYADDQFVAVGGYGKIMTSPDGESDTWTEQTSTSNDDFLASIVASGGSYYASGGYEGTVVVSDDKGSSWSDLSPGSVSWFKGVGLAVLDDRLIAVGFDTVYDSIDAGVTWREQMLSLNTYLNDIVYTGSEFMAVGDGGTTVLLDP